MDASVILSSQAVQVALGLLHSPQAKGYVMYGLAAVGATALAPKLLKYAMPKVVLAADYVSGVALRLPVMGSVLLFFAPDIVKLIEDLSNALEQLLDTFSKRLEENLAKAAKDAQPPTATPPTPPPA